MICGDISPIEVVAHLPVFCEDNDLPYIYIPSREGLGQACKTNRPTSCALLVPKPGSKYAEKFAQIAKKVRSVNPYF